MSNTQSIQNTPPSSAAQLSTFNRTEVESALSDVLNALKGGKASAMMEKGKINEEQLYAAFVYNELKKSDPKAAEKLLKDLPSTFKNLKEKKDPKPIFGAVEKVLEQLKKSGKLSGSDVKRIKNESLGMAQVDRRDDRLGSRNIKFKDVGTVDPKTTYMDRLISKIEDNTTATEVNIKGIKKGFELAKEREKEYAPAKKPRIVKYQGEEAAPSPTVNNDKKVDQPSELDKAADKKVDGSTHRFEVTEFGYKPISEKDGNALIQIPAEIAKKVKLITVINSEGVTMAEVSPDFEENDGRRYARFDVPGAKFGKNFTVKLTFTDGYIHNERIEDSESIYSRKFLPA